MQFFLIQTANGKGNYLDFDARFNLPKATVAFTYVKEDEETRDTTVETYAISDVKTDQENYYIVGSFHELCHAYHKIKRQNKKVNKPYQKVKTK